jgi:hypothetical protein
VTNSQGKIHFSPNFQMEQKMEQKNGAKIAMDGIAN